MSVTPLSGALGALSSFLIADASLGETLQRVADITQETVPNAAFVGLTMLDERERVTTAIFTDEESPEIDRSQYESGRGPCLEAWRTKRVVRIDDIERDGAERYPEFADACKAHGVRSTLSMPLIAADRGIGAMNMYARERAGFSAADQDVSADLATAISAVLANAVAYWDAYDLSAQLRQAMASRAVIDQAKGMLMAKSPELGPDDAFDVLRKASQRENVKLRDIAQRIVDRRPLVPDAGAGTGGQEG